jgi:hypothetical protein
MAKPAIKSHQMFCWDSTGGNPIIADSTAVATILIHFLSDARDLCLISYVFYLSPAGQPGVHRHESLIINDRIGPTFFLARQSETKRDTFHFPCAKSGWL